MLERWERTVVTLLLLLFGCLTSLLTTSGVRADGRVFVLDLRNSSSPQSFREAERACASLHARLASAEELHHAVDECFFSLCTRGWLHGGRVGTTVCNVVGSALKAVDVRTENVTEDTAHLDAFCIKDRGMPCGDPPSFPNARLQGHSGSEMGDELLYTCAPGYVMPSGHGAFSLLCDSCGEWYGLVQLCVRDETESHIDYEDKFTDSYTEETDHSQRPEEAQGEVFEEVHGATYPGERRSQEQQETSFGLAEHPGGERGDDAAAAEASAKTFEGVDAGGEKHEDRAVEDFIGHPVWEQESSEVLRVDAGEATEAPVSLLSQKHMFWFPSEAFREEGQPVSTNPVTQTSQRTSGTQSEESREQESQETQHATDVSVHVHGPDHYHDHHDAGDGDGHEDSRHEDSRHEDSRHEDSRHDDSRHDHDHDGQQEEYDHDDHLKHHIPAQHEDLDRRDRHHHHDDHDDHDDHYDMGEHEDERVPYGGGHSYDDRDDAYDQHESYEDHEDLTDDHGEGDVGDSENSEEHPGRHDDHYDPEGGDNDSYTERRDHDDSYEDHDSREDGGDQRVIVSIATDVRENDTATTTDETWLDGYPVVAEETENDDSTTEGVNGEGAVTDRPNEVEVSPPAPDTGSPEEPESPTAEPGEGGVEGVLPDSTPSIAPSPDQVESSDSPSYSDTLDTQQAAPTHSWRGDLTADPFLDYGPAPPVGEGAEDVLTEGHATHDLPGEAGERGEVEGEMGGTICVGDDCPPPQSSSASRNATITVIIVGVCVLAAAVVVGAWCYRRQQQKSSMYEMNGKGHSRQGQHIEMQQKV